MSLSALIYYRQVSHVICVKLVKSQTPHPKKIYNFNQKFVSVIEILLLLLTNIKVNQNISSFGRSIFLICLHCSAADFWLMGRTHIDCHGKGYSDTEIITKNSDYWFEILKKIEI